MRDQQQTAEPGSPLTATKSRGRAERKQARADRKSAPKQPSEIREQVGGMLRAIHPRQTVLTALVVAAAALISGRPLREGLVAGAAVLVVQAILGLVNDVVDCERDTATASCASRLPRAGCGPATPRSLRYA